MRRGLLALVVCLGCASATQRYVGMEADEMLEHGLDRLAAQKWDEAVRVLEQFVFQYPDHARYHEARFRMGEAHFGKQEYLIAAAEFARLANDFPGGTWADDARFKVCDSYYRLSPRAQLDQEYTRLAIDHCLSLVVNHPDSQLAVDARTMVTELEDKLAQKVLDVGDHYFRRNAFDSAIVYYEKVLAGFAATGAAPKALLGLYRSYEEIGWEEEARQTRERLLREFPASDEAKGLISGAAQTPS